MMKSMKITGLCLVTMCVMSIVAVEAATAAGPVWEKCSEGGTATKYETNQCQAVLTTGKFQWNEIKAKETVILIDHTLTLKDLNTPGGKSSVRCTAEDEGEGTVGPGNKGEIDKIEVKEPKKCTVLEGPCKAGEVEVVKGIDVPWKSELFETEKTVDTDIGNTGKGEPGWEVKCNTLIGKTTDTCTYEEKFPEVDSLRTLRSRRQGTTLVSGRFLERRRLHCSLGGTEEGEVQFELGTELKGAGLGVK